MLEFTRPIDNESALSFSETKLPALVRSLRPHQWVKNLLIFAPMIAAHHWNSFADWKSSTLAFAVFCLLASSVYLLNDIVDLEADRVHRSKRHRPLASGQLKIRHAIITQLLLLSVALTFSFSLSWKLGYVTAAYFVMSASYSLWLKATLAMDVLTLCLLYIARLAAGHAVTGIHESFWMLGFFTFLFLSLALMKRFCEIDQSESATIAGRGYQIVDRQIIAGAGISSGLIASMVLALYINSPDVLKLYAEPRWLWLSVPLFIAWILRAWILAGRGQIHDDPVVFALREPLSYALLFVLCAIAVLAIHF